MSSFVSPSISVPVLLGDLMTFVVCLRTVDGFHPTMASEGRPFNYALHHGVYAGIVDNSLLSSRETTWGVGDATTSA
ncbi:hypothetical protein JAAARDRAFT_197757 [Jaapia argillacea MUCL 33604]|uniref:Uncharacterized protein n=1 Tax=Jaapia argillacea MUCL 33604 TaxID=933084 RepID=A0A067PDZ8_9AGAM|nr:hypothetical protein JAAARDRAFT_197757 [Jaapia argillacea MUCL 33604]